MADNTFILFEEIKNKLETIYRELKELKEKESGSVSLPVQSTLAQSDEQKEQELLNQYGFPTNRIKEVLIEKGIKQTWLAEKLGKSFTIVNSYVCNRRQPSLELLFQIAEILQVNPKELINNPDE